jgi:hypothetical protein
MSGTDAAPPRKSLIGSVLDASLNDHDPVDAAWHALEHNNHRTKTRRLVEMANYVGSEALGQAVNYGAELAPLLFGESTSELPSEDGVPDEPGWEGARQVARFVFYDSFVCYLYPPPHMTGEAFGDGTTVELHYSNRACFPMIPFLPPDMPTFEEAYGVPKDFRWDSLEYETACDSSTVKSLIGPMMGELSTFGIIAAPYGSMLRVAEGIDSIRNFAAASSSDTNVTGAAIVCGVAQLGGLLWLSLTLVFMGAFCVCAPLGSVCCLKLFRWSRRASSKKLAREAAIDSLLADAEGSAEQKPLWGSGA